MTFNDWIQSVNANDGRKWILEEGPAGETVYMEQPAEQFRLPGGDTPLTRRNRKVREQMNKRVGREGKPWCWRLGYNHCIGQFAQSGQNATLTGSSLNRSLRETNVKPGAKLFIEQPEKVAYQEPRTFSKRSRAKVKDKTTALWRALEPKIIKGKKKTKLQRTFATLTFIEDLPDEKAVKILNKFLNSLRKEMERLQYLWVAERQEQNNDRLHFHMLLDRKLEVRRYNALWVLQQYNAGLVGRSATGEVYSIQEIRRRYEHDMTAPFKKHDPDGIQAILNPFDIEPATSISGLSKYLTLYITKQSAEATFGCQTWHCSRKVSKLFTKELVGPSTFAYLLSPTNYGVDRRTGEIYDIPKPITHQFYTMIYVNNKKAPLARLKQMEQVNRWIIDDFEPDRLPQFSNWLYNKFMASEKTEVERVKVCTAVPCYYVAPVKSIANGKTEEKIYGANLVPCRMDRKNDRRSKAKKN